jgi:hypothetical protein
VRSLQHCGAALHPEHRPLAQTQDRSFVFFKELRNELGADIALAEVFLVHKVRNGCHYCRNSASMSRLPRNTWRISTSFSSTR